MEMLKQALKMTEVDRAVFGAEEKARDELQKARIEREGSLEGNRHMRRKASAVARRTARTKETV